MLKAAAERGVIVNIIVYKEVQAALTLDSAVGSHLTMCVREAAGLTNMTAYETCLGSSSPKYSCVPPP